MKIQKLHLPPKKILFKFEVPKAGNLQTDSRPSVRPWGKIVKIGSEVQNFKVGQVLFVSAWGAEEVDYEGEKYHFIDYDHPAVCGAYEV